MTRAVNSSPHSLPPVPVAVHSQSLCPVDMSLSLSLSSSSVLSSLSVSQFQLGDVTQFAAHQENGRLMGFVVEGRDWSEGEEEGTPSFSAFVFESNTEGEKVTVHTTLKIAP